MEWPHGQGLSPRYAIHCLGRAVASRLSRPWPPSPTPCSEGKPPAGRGPGGGLRGGGGQHDRIHPKEICREGRGVSCG